MNRKRIIMLAVGVALALALGVYVMQNRPVRKTAAMQVANLYGESAWMELDLTWYPNYFLPDYVKGSITLDGVTYVDSFEAFGKSPALQMPFDWWNHDTLSTNVYYRTENQDVMEKASNFIFLGAADPDYAWVSFILSHGVEDNDNPGKYYYGPAENAEDARTLAARENLYTPS